MENILYPDQIEYLKSFKTNDDELILEMERYAAEKNVPILNWTAVRLLEQTIKLKKPKSILEFGTAIGYSSIRMARLLEEGSQVHTIELSRDNMSLATANISKAGLEEKITIIPGEAKEVISGLTTKYDFIFLDVDKEDYLALYEPCIAHLNNGGVLFVDNLLWKGYAAKEKMDEKILKSTKHIKAFNEVFLRDKRFDVSLYSVGDGVGIGILK